MNILSMEWRTKLIAPTTLENAAVRSCDRCNKTPQIHRDQRDVFSAAVSDAHYILGALLTFSDA